MKVCEECEEGYEYSNMCDGCGREISKSSQTVFYCVGLRHYCDDVCLMDSFDESSWVDEEVGE